MLASKSRSGSSEIPHRTSPGTSRVSKQPRGAGGSDGEATPTSQSGRNAMDKVSKIPDRRSPKSTLAEKRVGAPKASELQQQLNQAQEDLKKAKEQLGLAENAKAKALEEVEESKKAGEEANLKLSEALVAQKRALEQSESEKFRADELEQATIEASQKRDQAWQSELEAVQRQHALDVSALLSTTQELQRVKQDLSIATESKAKALKLAEDAASAAEANAKRAEELFAELGIVKESLDAAYANRMSVEDEKAATNAQLESQAKEAAAMAAKANEEVQLLKKELANAKDLESKLSETQGLVEKLSTELQNAKESESKAAMLAAEANMKLERAEMEAERAREAENKAFESLKSATAELEDAKMCLEKSKADSAYLTETVDSLRSELERRNQELQDAETSREKALVESGSLTESLEAMKSELDKSRSDLIEAEKKEQLAGSKVSQLTEEMDVVREELQQALEAEEKSKKAMDDLVLALHEVTEEASDARHVVEEAHEDLRAAQLEAEHWKAELEDTQKKYQEMLDEARGEIEEAKQTAERAKLEVEESMVAWNERESKLVDCIRQAESEANTAKEDASKILDSLQEAESEAKAAKEEVNRLLIALQESESEANKAKQDVSKLSVSLRQAEDEANTAEENANNLLDSLKQFEAEASAAKEDVDNAKVEIAILKDALMDKENELQSIIQENEDLKYNEAAALRKVEQLKESLILASSQKSDEHETKVTKEEYDLLQQRLQEAEEHANKRIAEALERVESVNTKEHETQEKLNVANLELESLRKKENESSEHIEALRIANMTVEADLKKSKEEAEEWKKAADMARAAVALSRNGEMNGKVVNRSVSVQEHLPSESFGDAQTVDDGLGNKDPLENLQMYGPRGYQVGVDEKGQGKTPDRAPARSPPHSVLEVLPCDASNRHGWLKVDVPSMVIVLIQTPGHCCLECLGDVPWIMAVGASFLDRSLPSHVRLGSESVFYEEFLMLVCIFMENGHSCLNGNLSFIDVKRKILLCGQEVLTQMTKGRGKFAGINLRETYCSDGVWQHNPIGIIKFDP